jgi:hypothetical protein
MLKQANLAGVTLAPDMRRQEGVGGRRSWSDESRMQRRAILL